jgi:hypothetical protein
MTSGVRFPLHPNANTAGEAAPYQQERPHLSPKAIFAKRHIDHGEVRGQIYAWCDLL